MTGLPKITVGRTQKGKLADKLLKVRKMATYVGVPAQKASRKGGGINNAELLFVLTKGSPLRKLPATPWLEPAIAADGNREPIAHELAEAAKAVLHDNPTEATKRLKRAGQAGQDAARAWPNDPRNGWPRLSKRTEQARMRKMKGETLKKTKAALAAGGYPFVRNIDTGALRNAIIHVEREE